MTNRIRHCLPSPHGGRRRVPGWQITFIAAASPGSVRPPDTTLTRCVAAAGH